MHTRDKKRIYGLTEENHQKMLKIQNKVCAICEQKNGLRDLFIDHNHATGLARGLLCTRCNTLLAAIEDPGFLRRAKKYLSFPTSTKIASVELDPIAKEISGWKKRT